MTAWYTVVTLGPSASTPRGPWRSRIDTGTLSVYPQS